MITNPAIIAELKSLNAQNGGLLKPEQVVEAARDPGSPLHDQFQWDDTAAAEAYRIQQARGLLRVCVQWIGEGVNRHQAPVFVNLTSDRYESKGYRTTVSVLSDEQLRAQMLEDALTELNRFRRKYHDLAELAQLFAAFDAITKQSVA
ncbi:MAG TPA: hypothetical protein DCQ83_07415 [Fibrobacteres bacterium]|nr:hypothetical protein [Fibrobacterota bacterium]